MSKLYDFRAALRDSIVAANIGWTLDAVIIKRQSDLWNDVATAINASAHGAVLHIGIASGESTEDESLEIEVSVPITILCLPQAEDGSTPEEDLWEALVQHVHDLRLGTDHHTYRFRFKSFSDLEIEADGGTAYLARQTTFTRRLSL